MFARARHQSERARRLPLTRRLPAPRCLISARWRAAQPHAVAQRGAARRLQGARGSKVAHRNREGDGGCWPGDEGAALALRAPRVIAPVRAARGTVACHLLQRACTALLASPQNTRPFLFCLTRAAPRGAARRAEGGDPGERAMQRRTRHQAACAARRGRSRAAERRGAPRAKGARRRGETSPAVAGAVVPGCGTSARPLPRFPAPDVNGRHGRAPRRARSRRSAPVAAADFFPRMPC